MPLFLEFEVCYYVHMLWDFCINHRFIEFHPMQQRRSANTWLCRVSPGYEPVHPKLMSVTGLHVLSTLTYLLFLEFFFLGGYISKLIFWESTPPTTPTNTPTNDTTEKRCWESSILAPARGTWPASYEPLRAPSWAHKVGGLAPGCQGAEVMPLGGLRYLRYP